MRWIIPLLIATTAEADMLLEDFSEGAERRWQYISDQVMGGVSEGGAVIGEEDARRFAVLAGDVSTANNGGFIQLRRDLATSLEASSTGLTLSVRGENGPYFVHVRTRDSRRPWQFYQAPFPVNTDWTTTTLQWSAFKAQGEGLPSDFSPEDIVSIALVAYGRDHRAQLSVSTIEVNHG